MGGARGRGAGAATALAIAGVWGGACAVGQSTSAGAGAEPAVVEAASPSAPAQAQSEQGGAGSGGDAAANANIIASVGPASPNAPTGNANLPAAPVPFAASYTFVGRTDLTDPNAPIFRMPNSAIGATFVGTQVGARFTAGGDDRWEAVVDGGAPTVVTTRSGDTNVLYPVAQGLTAGSHSLWLTKRTELIQFGADGQNCGASTFLGLGLGAGGALGPPPARQSRRLLAMGDSSFTGYGSGQVVTGSADDCGFTPATENAQASVPARLAALLGAELHNISFSGMGVASSVYDSDLTHALPYIWRQLAPHQATPLWDANRFVPDVVVISGGGDDLVGNPGAGTFPNRAQFVSVLSAWLAAIRQTAPAALVVVATPSGATGADIATLGGAIREAVTGLADPNIISYWYFDGDPNYADYGQAAVALKLYWGCRGHPSAAGAAFLAGRLAQRIAPMKGWTLP